MKTKAIIIVLCILLLVSTSLAAINIVNVQSIKRDNETLKEENKTLEDKLIKLNEKFTEMLNTYDTISIEAENYKYLYLNTSIQYTLLFRYYNCYAYKSNMNNDCIGLKYSSLSETLPFKIEDEKMLLPLDVMNTYLSYGSCVNDFIALGDMWDAECEKQYRGN